MLETLTTGFRNARARLKGFRQINEENIEEALEQVRTSLLEADVEYHVTAQFLERVKTMAMGELVQTKVVHKGKEVQATPADHFIKICHDELVRLMGQGDTSIKFNKTRPFTTIMMCGLQGSGKTTTAGKLARNLKKQGKRPLLVAADIYRPAAVNQLQVLGERIGVPVFFEPNTAPPILCRKALDKAKKERLNVVIFDTAGRLAIDEALMKELEEIQKEAGTDNVFLVVDSMIGQDAVKVAKEFDRRLSIDGVILTKLDGDARGGAALSVRAVTGKPIKFAGMGEGLDRLEPFRPEGLASRILGFGDVVGLMKDFEDVVDAKKAEADAMRMLRGDFTFLTFLEQIRTLKKLGPLQSIMEKLPFFPDGLPQGMNVDDKALVRIEAIIQSMTPQERTKPALLTDSRIKRIAKGAGRTEADVKDLVARFDGMRKMMTQLGQNPALMRGMGMPPMPQQGGRGGRGMQQMQAPSPEMMGMMPPPGMGGMPGMGMPGMGGMPGMPGPAPAKGPKHQHDLDKRRKKEKAAKAARKKNRKK